MLKQFIALLLEKFLESNKDWVAEQSSPTLSPIQISVSNGYKYTPPADGYLRCGGGSNNNLSIYAGPYTDMSVNNASGVILSTRVRKGVPATLYVDSPTNAWFTPCIGTDN